MKAWYEELFSNFARGYDRECFTQGTVQEVDFIEAEIGWDKGVRILDVGCGTGRHAIEFARRGYQVTGIDLSENQLAHARGKANAAGVNPVFERRDARLSHYESEFELVMMLCEGGFSLMETDAMNYAILENAVRALRPEGRFVFTCLNALFPLAQSVQDFVNAGESSVKTTGSAFDLSTLRVRPRVEFPADSGVVGTLDTSERHYVPSEVTWYMHCLGMKDIGVYGGTVGAFEKTPPTPGHLELLVVVTKV